MAFQTNQDGRRAQRANRQMKQANDSLAPTLLPPKQTNKQATTTKAMMTSVVGLGVCKCVFF